MFPSHSPFLASRRAPSRGGGLSSGSPSGLFPGSSCGSGTPYTSAESSFPAAPDHTMFQIFRLYFMRNYAAMEHLEVHPGQAPVLALLCARDGCTQKEIAEQLLIRPPTVAVMMKRMEKNGLLTRRQDEKDARSMRVYITDNGRKMHTDIVAARKKMEADMFRGFTDEEKAAWWRLVAHMCANLREETRDPACSD